MPLSYLTTLHKWYTTDRYVNYILSNSNLTSPLLSTGVGKNLVLSSLDLQFIPFPYITKICAVLTFSFFFATQHVGSQFPDQGWNQCPLKWKPGGLTTGPPGKSLDFSFVWVISSWLPHII